MAYQGCGTCYFRDPHTRNNSKRPCCTFRTNGIRLVLRVMPNHCHAMMRPFAGWELEDLLQGLKGVVAHRVNSVIGSRWLDLAGGKL